MKKNTTLKQDILIILFIFLAVFSIIIIKPISDLDEIWNYNTARAISQGLIPYKDISMITTPVLPMLTTIILKVIANEIIVSRILAAILWTGILFLQATSCRRNKNTSSGFRKSGLPWDSGA